MKKSLKKVFMRLTKKKENYIQATFLKYLVMNKVDLVTNKSKFRDMQNELDDIGHFEKYFIYQQQLDLD